VSLPLSGIEVPVYKYFLTNLMDRCGAMQWARLRLLQACERLKIPVELWPKIPFPELPRDAYHYDYVVKEQFQPPEFHVLYESEAEWRARAQVELDVLLDKCAIYFRGYLQGAIEGKALTPIKQTRDTTPLDLRYEWAARRYCYRKSFPELAKEEVAEGRSYTAERIKRTVNRIIREAGLRKGT
jgi:hypothetical protein